MSAPIVRGNKKLPRTTAILNITPASTCPSRALGMCQLDKCGVGSGKCYALNAELRYGKPHTLPFRMRQQEWWDQGVTSLVSSFLNWRWDRRTNITAVRLGESGDFRHAGDVEKMKRLALANASIVWYCYTARRDLFPESVLKSLPLNVVVNGSGWMAHNKYLVLAGRNAGAYYDHFCPADCRRCRRCLQRGGITIGARLH